MGTVSKISVVLPAYNERENLEKLVPEIAKTLDGKLFEIIVVDDNSPDGTSEAMNKLKESISELQLIVRKTNKGFANSIREGLEKSSGDILIVMDSDFNHKPEYLPLMIENLKFFDCVSASRFLYGGKMESSGRQILSWLFNIFVRIMTGGKVTDSLYGYFSIKRKSLNKVNFDDIFWGYGDYCIRLMYFLQKHKVNILQFPALNGNRVHGIGNTRFIWVFLVYFKAVVRLTWKIGILKNV